MCLLHVAALSLKRVCTMSALRRRKICTSEKFIYSLSQSVKNKFAEQDDTVHAMKTSFGLNKRIFLILFPGKGVECFFFSSVHCVILHFLSVNYHTPGRKVSPGNTVFYSPVFVTLLPWIVVDLKTSPRSGGWPALLPSSCVNDRRVIYIHMGNPGWTLKFLYRGLTRAFHLNIHAQVEEINIMKKSGILKWQTCSNSNDMCFCKMTSWSRPAQITSVWLSQVTRLTQLQMINITKNAFSLLSHHDCTSDNCSS